MIRLSLSLLISLAAIPASAQEDNSKVTPLFADEAILEITLTGPINDIVRQAERSTKPHPATLAGAGETHAITLAARGVSRRKKEICEFPPLRITFNDKPGESSLFHKQGRIKLVTHCRARERAQQTVLREYTAYRLYNALTPKSLKVRLARITYVDEDQVIITRLGFLIEDADDAARRLGMKEIDVGSIPVSALNREDAARYALFQYMIGNTDWAMRVGPDPDACCHNSRLLGADKEARRELTPLPYDFDNAGLVDAVYAVPNEALGLRSVRTRVYRGFCGLNSLVPAEAARLREVRSVLEAEIAAIPMADPRTAQAMTRYLDGFFEDIADDDAVQNKLLKNCR